MVANLFMLQIGACFLIFWLDYLPPAAVNTRKVTVCFNATQHGLAIAPQVVDIWLCAEFPKDVMCKLLVIRYGTRVQEPGDLYSLSYQMRHLS